LGLPLRAPYKSYIWDGIIEKMEKRLAGWKKTFIFEQILAPNMYEAIFSNLLW